jgi:histone H3/H4
MSDSIYYNDVNDIIKSNNEESEEDNNMNENNEESNEESNEENNEESNEESEEDNNEEKGKGNDKKKKKTNRYFEHHIRKILKQICPERNITKSAKEALNEIMILTCNKIINKAFIIVTANNKKTLTEYDLECSIKLLFTGQLSQKSVEEGYKCLKNYFEQIKDENNKGKSRTQKADIIVPPSLLEKFLKNKGFNISNNCSIFLAGVIEYFASQILELSNNITLKKNHSNHIINATNTRLNIYHIENGVRLDKELNQFFISNNIYIHDSGIIPYLHPYLKNKTSLNDKKSIDLITKIQENNSHIFSKSCIDNKFKNNIGLIYPDARFQKDCFDYFQDYLEKWMIELLQYSNNITLSSKKARVSGNDIELALSITERRQPSFLNLNEEECKDDFINFDEEKEEIQA